MLRYFLCLSLYTAKCSLISSDVSACATTEEHIKVQEVSEIEGVNQELLQNHLQLEKFRTAANQDLLENELLVGKARTAALAIRECPRVDARLLAPDDLKQFQEPTILENFWIVLDNTTWARSDFERDGTFGHLPMTAYNVLHNEVRDGNIAGTSLFEYMSEAIDHDQPDVMWVFANQAEPLVADMQKKNGVAPSNLSLLLDAMTDHFGITLENAGQWARVHTHNASLFTQVSGRKGWIFGDEWAFHGQKLTGDGWGGGPIHDHILDQKDVCGLFKGVLPRSVAKRPQNFRMCETRAGEGIIWPQLCNGECGWWHGTCGLDAWSTGITHIGWREFS